ncbi:hypothetical protein NUACC26_048460 [Scytonema sp. NUACC26]
MQTASAFVLSRSQPLAGDVYSEAQPRFIRTGGSASAQRHSQAEPGNEMERDGGSDSSFATLYKPKSAPLVKDASSLVKTGYYPAFA